MGRIYYLSLLIYKWQDLPSPLREWQYLPFWDGKNLTSDVRNGYQFTTFASESLHHSVTGGKYRKSYELARAFRIL